MPTEKSQSNITYPTEQPKVVLLAFWEGTKGTRIWYFLVLFSVVLNNALFAIIPLFYKGFFDTVSEVSRTEGAANSLIAIII
ncbi:MAG: hypothetical protein Q8Q48_01005, partial [Candidatus Staskawiczbacteria bacterium]|nr:hypothetical protein [Candidatus Staskawiczbacteria bacterium]